MTAKGAPVMRVKALCTALSAALLASCVSLGGGDPPDQLLTLTAVSAAEAGTGAEGAMADALSVIEPDAPQRLDINRVPVRASDSSVLYLQDAVWVEKPARLFQRVLSETIRARGERLVIGGGDLEYAAATQLGGELVAMDYDARRSQVVVRYDAVLRLPSGELRTQRFESVVEGVFPDALSVGPALNQAANEVAVQVAEWVG